MRHHTTLIFLKYAYQSGHIHNFNSRVAQLTVVLGYKDRRTVKRHVEKLVEEGLAWWEGDGLRFTNRKVLSQRFQCKFRERYFDFNKPLLPQFYALQLLSMLNRQHYRVKEKFLKEGLKLSNKKSGSYYDGLIEEGKTCAKEGKVYFLGKDVHPYITLSRRGVAQKLGYKSRSSGTRKIRLLKKNNLIVKDQPEDCFPVVKMDAKGYSQLSYDDFPALRYFHHWWFKGCVYAKPPNTLVVKDNR